MKKIVLVSMSVAVLLFTGCNTVSPNERVDRTSLTKKMNFAEVKKTYISATYNQNEFLKNLYFVWLQDNLERVNPFLDLQKWKHDVELQHQKDLKYVTEVEKNYMSEKCGAREYLIPLFAIRYKTHWKKLENVRYKIVQNLIKLKCEGKYLAAPVLNPNPADDEAWYWRFLIRPDVLSRWHKKYGI